MIKKMKTIARTSILSEMFAFPSTVADRWKPTFLEHIEQEGDLVAMSAAPPSKWYLSWIREIQVMPGGDRKYLLESIEDGALCWWSNIGISVYDRQRVNDHPSWRWEDRQFAFSARWRKVCFKWNDAYLLVPQLPVFEGDSVTLDVRIKFHFHNFSNPTKFENWKKVTMKMMDRFYKECNRLNNLNRLFSAGLQD